MLEEEAKAPSESTAEGFTFISESVESLKGPRQVTCPKSHSWEQHCGDSHLQHTACRDIVYLDVAMGSGQLREDRY